MDLLSLLVINNEQNEDSGHIAEMEILKVIHKGKTGSDGVTYEFYKEFGNLLLRVLCGVFNETLEKGTRKVTGQARGIQQLSPSYIKTRKLLIVRSQVTFQCGPKKYLHQS